MSPSQAASCAARVAEPRGVHHLVLPLPGLRLVHLWTVQGRRTDPRWGRPLTPVDSACHPATRLTRSLPLRSPRAALRRMAPRTTASFYSRSFVDLDGHPWQAMWMDPAAAQRGLEEFAAPT